MNILVIIWFINFEINSQKTENAQQYVKHKRIFKSNVYILHCFFETCLVYADNMIEKYIVEKTRAPF